MALDFYSTIEQLLNPTQDLGGGPGSADNARAIAQLILGGGSAGLEGQALFGQPPVASGAPLGPGSLGVSSPAINQEGIIQLPGSAESPQDARSGPVPGQTLQNVLASAKSMAEGLSPGSTAERKTLVGNPFGPGSYDPNDPTERQSVLQQGQKVEATKRAQELLSSPGLSRLPATAQESIVQSILRSIGIGGADENLAAFQKAFATAKGTQAAKGNKADETLSVERLSKLSKFNPESRLFEPAPDGVTEREASEGGYRVYSDKQKELVAELNDTETAFRQLKGSWEGVKQQNLPTRLSTEIPVVGTYLNPEGALYRKDMTNFTTIFDKFLGGVRGAASPQMQKIRSAVLPQLSFNPAVGEVLMAQMEDLISTMANARISSVTGQKLPPEAEEVIKQKAQRVIDEFEKQQKQLSEPVTPASEKQAAAGRVRVVAPDGRAGTISADSLDEALKAGYKRQ